MRVSRLCVPDLLEVGQKIDLQEESAHYIRTVLRLKKDQAITLFNGLGGEFLCVTVLVAKKKVSVQIIEAIDRTAESSLYLKLGLSISRGGRMDWGIQKAVELGANNITPLITERCVVKFKDENKKQLKHQHWKNIVQHATEQSGRTILPTVAEISSLAEWIKNQQEGLKVFLDPYADKSLSELTPDKMQITLLSGPEGGFSSREKELAIAANFTPIRLGNRVLRTETASLAAISAAQVLWGDFK